MDTSGSQCVNFSHNSQTNQPQQTNVITEGREGARKESKNRRRMAGVLRYTSVETEQMANRIERSSRFADRSRLPIITDWQLELIFFRPMTNFIFISIRLTFSNLLKSPRNILVTASSTT
ncbi:Serine/threonine-protein phosphatase 2A activator [Dirofilaria immitis]|nr:hypothetical protein [Dirofilaria immitis]